MKYPIINNNKNIPIMESKYPNAIIIPSITTDNKINNPSLIKLSCFMRIGCINAESPKINNIFEIFDPITLPNATPGAGGFDNIALIDAASSGNDVPTPINIIPIINGDKRNLCASATPL